jgi:hypothetical protein
MYHHKPNHKHESRPQNRRGALMHIGKQVAAFLQIVDTVQVQVAGDIQTTYRSMGTMI